ncbi:MAG: quinate 5-dehydrogenase [Sulfobacillus thermosulfidooxidans]|nr:MAG: quinate 5-dehydrogenase [Sulfobacillus thermosulfidooxidans]
MTHVVSVSLGSARRDHQTTAVILDQAVEIVRQGTDGDMERARQWIASLDGKVDVIGLGGIDRYLVVKSQRYEIRDAQKLAQAARHTPVVDGSGLKAVWEPHVIQQLVEMGLISPHQKVLLVSAMDRFGMAEAFYTMGFPTIAGDLIFASHIDYPIQSLGELEEFARKLLPDLIKMPFSMLYPTGSEQDHTVSNNAYGKYFNEADIIAGDFHFIRRYLPDQLQGKVIVTNTTTRDDRLLLEERHLQTLVTTTPFLDGRSFGTNVMEAALVAISGVRPEDNGWADVVMNAGLQWHVSRFEGAKGNASH